MKTKIFLYSLLLSYLTIFLFAKNIEGDKVLGYPISFLTYYDIEYWYTSPLSVLNPFNVVNISLNVAAFLVNAMVYFFILLFGIKLYKKLTIKFFS
ncbi:hypothetical protein [Ornithinibacillus bavariensis]|uniref:Uncharacterized protein n=1 Tax=Ornithinibacillus bavariensis TaxID=545502 RepID=A0A920C707_9BACI|nr:hypothetical protein [Ornithinibacillus bavariensis]GIO28360.1 hypothetical protein J43TS3_29710 [Ornithinibacillus bavariensis]